MFSVTPERWYLLRSIRAKEIRMQKEKAAVLEHNKNHLKCNIFEAIKHASDVLQGDTYDVRVKSIELARRRLDDAERVLACLHS